jgi:hypothetical protein
MLLEVLDSLLEVSSMMNVEAEEEVEIVGQINSLKSRCIIRVEGNK